MTQETESAETRPEPPPLKVPEPEVNPQDPWGDDRLERKEVADRLTSIVRDQEQPFVITVDGGWGTGKTFLLRRWQQDLQNQKFQAIYFNAWRDDFSKDPLLAIIGQLSEHFDDGMLKKAAFAVADAALGILTKHLTGTAIHVDDLTAKTLLDDYRAQQETRTKVREQLTSLAAAVHDDTGQPLVFIIDELDRCRPTFAIELLERVKHIFDVPNIVFVFGINRAELVKALESVYGEIDAGVYLRRFFDMEFVLSEADPENFCLALFDKFQLQTFFASMTAYAKNRVHSDDFQTVARHTPIFFRDMGLSLRDIDHSIRVIALLGRSIAPRYYMHPFILIALVVLKIDDPHLYRRFVQRECRPKEVINYIDEKTSVTRARNRRREMVFDDIELGLYSADAEVWSYLRESGLPDYNKPVPVDGLSERTKADEERLDRLAQEARSFRELGSGSLASVAKMIDLVQVGAED